MAQIDDHRVERNAARRSGARRRAAPQFVNVQSSDMLSPNVVGLDVHDIAGHDIGKIQDVAFDGDKAVTGYVLSVGGFLGAGSHYVAVDASSVKIDYDANGKKWRATMAGDRRPAQSAPASNIRGNGTPRKS